MGWLRSDGAALVVGGGLHQPIFDVFHDHLLLIRPRRRRTPRPVTDSVALRIIDDVGHVLAKKVLAPRRGGVVDEGERRDANLLRGSIVDARRVPEDTIVR